MLSSLFVVERFVSHIRILLGILQTNSSEKFSEAILNWDIGLLLYSMAIFVHVDKLFKITNF